MWGSWRTPLLTSFGLLLDISLVQVLEEEDLAGNATRMGRIMEEELATLDPQIVTAYRGRGLFWGLVIKNAKGTSSA